jgi:hypothetical protein
MILAEALAAGGRAVAPLSEELSITAEPVYLRFDLSEVRSQSVERAVLVLSPHLAWRPTGRPVSLVVRAVETRWDARSLSDRGPVLALDRAARAVLPNRARTPVRLDVTNVVRAWQLGTAPAAGLSLSTDGALVAFAGLGAADRTDRPRLEVVLR